MVNKLKKYGLLLTISLSILGCGKIDNKPIPIITEPIITEPDKTNPKCNSIQPFSNGTVWKPLAEGGGAQYSGNPVLLIDKSFVLQFKSCVIESKNSNSIPLTCLDSVQWTQTPFSCFSNGDRQTWRLDVQATAIKNKALITCIDDNQVCNWQLGGRPSNRYE